MEVLRDGAARNRREHGADQPRPRADRRDGRPRRRDVRRARRGERRTSTRSSRARGIRTRSASSAACRRPRATRSGCGRFPAARRTSANVPSGCPFHPRCFLSRGRAACRESRPELRPVGSGAHRSACHFAEELEAASAPLDDGRSRRRAMTADRSPGARPGHPAGPQPGQALPDHAGAAAPDGRPGARRRRRRPRRRDRRDGRRRRRIRLRQDDARPHADPARRSDQRQRRVQGPGHHPSVAQRDAERATRHADRVPEPVRVARSADDGAEPDRRAAARARPVRRRAAGRSASPR